VQQKHTNMDFSSSNGNSWVILSDIEKSIKKKIEAVGTPLKDWDISIYRGVLTGCNEAFIISTEKRDEILNNCKTEEERKRTAELIRPILRGRDIKRYGYDWVDLFLIATFPSRHYDIEQYPAVKNYLLSFGMERLEQTGKKYNVGGQIVTARKKTNNKWFETQDTISYWEDFLKPKIVYAEISQEPKFYLDIEEHFYPEATSFLMVGKYLEYLCVLFHSKPITYFFKLFYAGGGLGETGYRYKKAFFENLPIPKFVDSVEQLALLKQLNIQPTFNDDKTNNLIYKIYKFSPDEITEIERS